MFSNGSMVCCIPVVFMVLKIAMLGLVIVSHIVLFLLEIRIETFRAPLGSLEDSGPRLVIG